MTLGAGVTSIGEAAFAECPNLKTMYFMGDAPSVSSNSLPENAVLHVQKGTSGWDVDESGKWNGCEIRVESSAPYCVIDLSGGTNAVSYPVSYLSDVPTGGWTDEYKTTKLVLRRIESGSFIMGSNQSLESHRVTISKPFYMGVFEVTQKQWELVMGGNPSYYKGDMRPVEHVVYNDIRGSSAGAGWPSSSTVDATSFLGKLRAKTVLDNFDLPTEAQWEYACRAGTTSDYNNGGDAVADLKTLGRYNGNTSDGRGGYSQHTTVGSYEPNAWGLYDMHGNVWEWCLDWNGTLSYGVDPVGPSYGSYRVGHGGNWTDGADDCTAFHRYSRAPSDAYFDGFRLVLGVTADGDSSEDAEESLDIVYGGRTWNCVVNDDQTLTVVGASPADGDLVIPSALNGMSVTGIDDSAFEDCTDLRSVVIPDSVTYLGADSFCDSGLTNAVIGRGVNFIREWAFEGCADLLSVTIPDGVEHIGESAFEGCASLTSVTLPSGVADVDVSAFGDCTGLESVVFEGDAPEEVGDDAFPSSATVYVLRDSAGWGVDIPGTWMGCAIQYAEPSSDVSTALYAVVDLSDGANAVSYSVSYLSAVPSGGWTDEHKTTKLVLRRIESGSFIMGDDQTNESHRVTLTKPFYIGVFEVTQKQWELVMGSNPSYYEGDKRPAEEVSYSDIRGSSAGAKWPTSSSVDSTSFLGKLRTKTGLDGFDLPTEAQWEYVCRAGTTSKYNNGGDTEDDLKKLGRYSDNQSDGRGGYSQHTAVGSYAPNAWGLYDMHGNVDEWCLDWYGSLFYGTDPVESASGSSRVLRGTSWDGTADNCASFARHYITPSYRIYHYGFRLVCQFSDDSESSDDDAPLGETWLCPSTEVQTHGPHTLDSDSCYEFFGISMTAGCTYTFETTGSGDTYGELFSSASTNASCRVAYDDDGGDNRNFKLSYTPTTSGTYYLRVRAYSVGTSLSYTLTYCASSLTFAVGDVSVTGWAGKYDGAPHGITVDIRTQNGCFVSTTGSDETGDGTSALPFRTIQKAVDTVADGEVVYVMPGVYEGFKTYDRNVEVVGAEGPDVTFVDGGGTNVCVDAGSGVYSSNALNDSICTNSMFRGIAFINGKAAEKYTGACQMGRYANCVISNCLYGSGVKWGMLWNCLVANNRSATNGGNMVGCVAWNCTIVGGYASNNGGGAYNCALYNSIVYGNSSGWDWGNDGGQIYVVSPWEGPAETYGNEHLNVYKSSPSFVDYAGGDYRLQADSPCIDAGSNAYVETESDLAGMKRIQNGTVDLGAYEHGDEPVSTSGSGLPVAVQVRYALAETGPYSATPPTLTDAGTMTVWCEISASGYIPLTNSATVSISPRSVTLTSGSASKESDGAALVRHEVSVGGDGFASGEGATYAFTGSQTAVGTSDNSFTYVLNANTKESNYDITVEYGTLTVNDRTWTHVVNSDGTATLTGVSSASGEVALPSEVDGCQVTAIGDSLFAGCTGLVSVTIPSRVTAIGANAFKGCTGLGGVTIPSRVASIGEGAFSGCTGLRSVTVPSRVTEIAASTFEGCTRLESVTLRGAVTSIGGRAFGGCTGLAAFAMPDALVSIGDFAFDGCTGIRDVVIPDGVLSVGAGAFCGSGVTNAALGVGVRMVRERTFDGCAGLRSVTLSAGITNICAASFRDCAALTSVDVPAAVEAIGESAFAGCTGLASVRFGGDAPASVGEGAFPEDAALYAIHGTDGWGVMIPGTWRGYALRYADGYRGFDVLMQGHSGIYDGTPHGVAVTVAGGVVGAQVKYALSAEGPFTSTAPAIADAGTSTVWCVVSASGYDAQTLSAEIAIAPRTVTFTSGSATKEYDGTALVCGEVAVGGDGFVSGEGAAFDVTGSRKAVGTSANTFTYTLNADTRASNYEIAAMFGELTVTDRIWTYDVNADGTATLTGVSSAKGDVAIPGIVDGHRVTALGASLFAGCAGMTEVTMPSSVTAIPDNAFSGCASLVSVSIPSRVTSIGEGAFSGCAAMKSVTLPARVTRIEARTFEDCIGLETVSIPSGVAFIASDAFSGCAAIRSVSVPARAHILSAAFPDSWRAITNVAVAAGTTAVDSFAFSDSVGLETVAIPSGVASIESDAFSGCTSLAAVAIPESVASIGEFAFSGCSALVEVGLPSGLAEIASSLFQDCAALASVAIPSGVETVGDYAFAGCASLEAVEMPKGLVELGESAFEGCSSLVTAAIPSGVETIGDYAFYGCSALEEIVFAGNAPAEVGGWAFPSSATVYVSRGSTGWGVDIPGAWMGCAIEYSAPSLPTVADDADATVTGDAEAGYVVTPGAGNGNVVVEIPDGVSAEKVTVVVSPDVSTVRPNGATVKVARNGHDVTAFLDVPAAVDGVIDISSATVKREYAEEPLDVSKGAEIGLGDSSSPSLKTAPTRKGLVYTLREGATLDAMKDGATTVGDGQPWTPAITVKGGSSGFYSIRVD